VELKNWCGNTPMWLACQGNYLEIAKLLFEEKAKLDSQNELKVSCLIIAFVGGHADIVKWILKNIPQLPSDKELFQYELRHKGNKVFGSIDPLKEQIYIERQYRDEEAKKNAAMLLESEQVYQKKTKQSGSRKKGSKAKKTNKQQQSSAGMLILFLLLITKKRNRSE